VGTRGGGGVPNNGELLGGLNADPLLCAKTILNNAVHDDELMSQFFSTFACSEYFDFASFNAEFSSNKKPIIMSLNIQSLQSKFANLKQFVCEVLDSNICLDMIVIQETWNVNHPELLEIPEFQKVIFETRKDFRGGGGRLLHSKGTKF